LWVDDKAITEQNGRHVIDANTLNPLARLGANQYANLGDVFSKVHPK